MFCKVIFGSSLRTMAKKEISSYQNRKEAFCETAFRNVIEIHRITRFSSVFCLLTHFSGSLHLDTCERNEASGEKWNILRWKIQRSFVRNFFVMSEFISQTYTYVSCSSPLSLFLRNQRKTCLDRILAYADKGNIISSKCERSILRNFFLNQWIQLRELHLTPH